MWDMFYGYPPSVVRPQVPHMYPQKRLVSPPLREVRNFLMAPPSQTMYTHVHQQQVVSTTYVQSLFY